MSATGGNLQLTFEGFAWWRDDNIDEGGKIIFTFVKPNSGAIDADLILECGDPKADEMLDEFFISDSAAGSLSAFPYLSLYGQSPLPDPQALYFKLDDYLRDLFTYKRPRDYLNCAGGGGGLVRFAELTQATGYLIAHAPGAICDIIVEELKAQGVAYYHGGAGVTRTNNLFIHWRGSVFECETAYAEFD